jgi:ribosomal protein S18 acetylase RimI-like enzyme
MFLPSISNISFITTSDIQAVIQLLNNAYRGNISRQGWTTEADLIAGDVRINEKKLLDVMNKPGSVILIYKDEQKIIKGCVNLQKHNTKIYLGTFGVSPQLQGGGIGKKCYRLQRNMLYLKTVMYLYVGYFKTYRIN